MLMGMMLLARSVPGPEAGLEALKRHVTGAHNIMGAH